MKRCNFLVNNKVINIGLIIIFLGSVYCLYIGIVVIDQTMNRGYIIGGILGIAFSSIILVFGSSFRKRKDISICPECNKTNPLSRKNCVYCNQSLNLKICLICKTRNSADQENCSKCGFFLKEPEEEVKIDE